MKSISKINVLFNKEKAIAQKSRKKLLKLYKILAWNKQRLRQKFLSLVYVGGIKKILIVSHKLK